MTSDGPDSRKFVVATVVKTVLFGGAIAVGCGLLVAPWFGLSVAAGAGVGAINFAAIAWIGRKMFDRAVEGGEDRGSPYVWVGLLSAKMLLLLVMATALVVAVGIDPIGFAVGFTIFVIAAIWSGLETVDRPGRAQ